MGKVEILTLIAGVVLSIALALIVIPMFSSSDEMASKQKIHQELIAIKTAVHMVHSVAASDIDFSDATKAGASHSSFAEYLKGMPLTINGANSYFTSANGVGQYNIKAGTTNPVADYVTITLNTSTANPSVNPLKLYEDNFTSLTKICNGRAINKASDITANTIVCEIKR